MKRTSAWLLAAFLFLGCASGAQPVVPNSEVVPTQAVPTKAPSKKPEPSCPVEGQTVEPPPGDIPLSPSAAIRLLCAREETFSAAISIEGIVVKTNLDEIPECAIHPTGIADPYDCRSPIPTFWLAETPNAPESTWIPVMGWASNGANLYEHVFQEAEGVNPDSYEDSFWGVIVPSFSLGGRVTVWGTYARTFSKTSTGWERHPATGVLTYRELMETAPGKTRAVLPSLRAPAARTISKVPETPRNLKVLPLSGPFPDLEKYCAVHSHRQCEFDESALATDLENSIVRLQSEGGFAEVSLFSQTADSRVTYLLGLQTSHGWFVADPGFTSETLEATGFMTSVRLRQVRYESQKPKGTTIVSVRVEKETSDEERQSKTRELFVCHVGRAPSPICFSPLTYSAQTRLGEEDSAYDFVPSFSEEGLLRLTPFWRSGEEPEQLGSYRLF